MHGGGTMTEACGNGCLEYQDDFVEVAPSVRLHIRDWGRGKPIVFVHGWPLCNEMFEYQFSPLAAAFRCVAPSLRGFGRSAQPWGHYHLDLFADDLRAVLEARALQDIVLAGFGMGGAVALRYMARHAGYRVSKLVFLAVAAPAWTKRVDFPQGGPEQTEVESLIALCRSDRARLVDDIVGRYFRAGIASSPRLADWLFQLGMQASPHAAAAALSMLGQADLRADMASVRVATLILHGSHDKLVPFGVAETLARGIRRAELVALEESGHALFWEEREKVNAELARFAT
jgi:non-heme chloroperoxidase